MESVTDDTIGLQVAEHQTALERCAADVLVMPGSERLATVDQPESNAMLPITAAERGEVQCWNRTAWTWPDHEIVALSAASKISWSAMHSGSPPGCGS
ncbi:hypothetical protein GWE18_40150 [Bradyrhizobium sp. CSA112]|uniref:hypothetical protein n=1 Tax=Bradyrhizobium sp. CSA112 TaxID=2699170 RepID=UPI0023B147FE|nr:hypothetical protein [Bradyrhizobium sp. CSA112]MDE5458839.1 hypothetical protein [Bradyrhizobium sp. CSA112]